MCVHIDKNETAGFFFFLHYLSISVLQLEIQSSRGVMIRETGLAKPRSGFPSTSFVDIFVFTLRREVVVHKYRYNI